MKGRKLVTIFFEDNGQDIMRFTAAFYPDYKFGQVIDSDMQGDIWIGMCILSGKPKKGDCIRISKSPDSDVILFKHKIEKVVIAKELHDTTGVI